MKAAGEFDKSSFLGLEERGKNLVALDMKDDGRKRWNGEGCRDSKYGQLFQQTFVERKVAKWSGSCRGR